MNAPRPHPGLSLRERLALAHVPRLFAGPPIAFVVAGMLAMAFMGFSGIAAS